MKDNVSVVIPVFTEEISKETVDNIYNQDYSNLNYEIMVVHDNPQKLTNNYKAWLKSKDIKLICNANNLGLAASYNQGFINSKYEKVIIIHEDCVPVNNTLIKNMIKALDKDPIVNATVFFPDYIVKQYDFWNKILLYRYTNLRCQAMGKITGFRKQILKQVKFDNVTYRTAGEDMDFMKQCRDKNITIGVINDEVIHKHRATKAGFMSVMNKAWQLGEGHGAYKRKYGLFNKLGSFDFELRTFFLILSLFTLIGLLPFFAVASWQAIKNYAHTSWLEGLLTYPFLGSLIMIVGTIAAIKAFITGRQTT